MVPGAIDWVRATRANATRVRILRRFQQLRWLPHAAKTLKNWSEVYGALLRGETVPTLVFRNGLRLGHAHEDDVMLLVREIFWQHCYGDSRFYRPQPGHTILDIGANIGVFALYMASQAPGIRVVCFEPASGASARLAENVRANRLGGAISVHRLAVSNRAGEAVLASGIGTGHGSFFASAYSQPSAQETVRCVSIDEALEMAGPTGIDLLKVDVEGAEIEIFEARELAKWENVKRVALEYHDAIRPGCCVRVTAALERIGFDRMQIVPASAAGHLGVIRARRGRTEA